MAAAMFATPAASRLFCSTRRVGALIVAPATPAFRRIARPSRLAVSASAVAVAGTPPQYGYLMVSVAFTAGVVQWMAINVAKARKEAGVIYPALYADANVVGEEKAKKFNCVQRSHQNTLETVPTVLVMQLLIAQVYPIFAAALGGLWAVGRIIYALGYSSGEPKKRTPGAAISGLVQLSMILVLAWLGITLIRA